MKSINKLITRLFSKLTLPNKNHTTSETNNITQISSIANVVVDVAVDIHQFRIYLDNGNSPECIGLRRGFLRILAKFMARNISVRATQSSAGFRIY